jgi:hypothetical protein
MRLQRGRTMSLLILDSSNLSTDVEAQERLVGTRNDYKKHLLDCLIVLSSHKG